METSLNRRHFLNRVVAGVSAASLPRIVQSAPDNSSRPNLLFICTDQQHWQAVGNVDSFFETPAMNQLAAEGTLFKNAFCTTPQCSASRSSLLTGYYPSTTGVFNNMKAAGGNPLNQQTIGKQLQAAGYQTAYFGKWHLGDDPVGNAGWNERKINIRDHEVTSNAIEYLNRNQQSKQPFALFLMYLNPHDIYHFKPGKTKTPGKTSPLSQSWYQEDLGTKPIVQRRFMTHNQGYIINEQPEEVWKQYRLFYREVVKKVDAEMGKVLEAVDRLGLKERTCRFFTSDHGDMDTNHRLIFKGPFMYEHMVRVPVIASIPKQYGGRVATVSDHAVVLTDFVPTLLDFANASIPDSHGNSMKPVLTVSGQPPARKFVISQYYGKQNWVNPIRMLRTDEFKYNRYIEHGEELYDLRNDPQEIVNLADDAEFQSIKQELSGKLDQWLTEHDDPFPTLTSNDSMKPDPAERRPKKLRVKS